ncbi:hypothetical protein LTR53_011489 [Teratosphaeriaceae sp. CCFEE 6253]|nr:hypothetical protein LTR53_011489 [Teratosphaeriaceae sp. CCFEE 6253]
MSTAGQFSSKNPTIKRILKEASELANQPSSDYHAAPLETDLFEWHFTIRGPPSPSPFEGGLYHGRVVLPPAYPLKPPSFRFLTPTGRFEVNREICLSISGHHEETWQPAWGIRTALVAIRSFMDTSASGQLGGMDASEEARKRMAGQSAGWRCPACGKRNAEVMREQDEAVKEQGGGEKPQETVPEGLRLAYRENPGDANGSADAAKANGSDNAVDSASAATQPGQNVASPLPPSVAQATLPRAASAAASPPQAPAQVQRPVPAQRPGEAVAISPWIDQCIYGVIAMLAFLIWRKTLDDLPSDSGVNPIFSRLGHDGPIPRLESPTDSTQMAMGLNNKARFNQKRSIEASPSPTD